MKNGTPPAGFEVQFRVTVSDVEAWLILLTRKKIVLRILLDFVVPLAPLVAVLDILLNDSETFSVVKTALMRDSDFLFRCPGPTYEVRVVEGH